MKKVIIIISMVILLAAFGMAQSWSTNSTNTSTHTNSIANTSGYTINISYKSGIGHYLVSSNGITLYYFTENVDGKTFNGSYFNFWSPFYVSQISVPKGLNPKDFSVVTGGNGKPQIAYKGWPLYYYIGDSKPGETNGQGFKGLWYVMKPDYTVMIATNSKIGNYLVNADGMTLYYLQGETINDLKCNGMCLSFWPAFNVSEIVVPSGLKASYFKIFTGVNGKSQMSYDGLPLHYFIRDAKRGDITGNNLRDPFGLWHAVLLNSQVSAQQSTTSNNTNTSSQTNTSVPSYNSGY